MSFTASLEEIVTENLSGLLSKRDHWPRVRLGEVAEIKNGIPLPSRQFIPDGQHPVVRIRNVVPGYTETYFQGEVEEDWFIEKGDLLVGMDGDFNSRRWPGPRALLNQRVCRVKPADPRLTLEYLEHVLPGYLKAVNDNTPSITVKHLSSRTISDLPIPIPPLPEQRLIVEAIDTQFSFLDSATQSLEQAKRNVERARASILKAAVEGRLVPTEAELARKEGREYEHASGLLQRILAERKARHEEDQKDAKRKKKYKEPVKPDTDGLPEPPEGWVWATVDQLGAVAGGQTPKGITDIAEQSRSSGDVPWFRVGDMNTQGNEKLMRHFSTWLTAEEVAGLGLNVRPPGTIVFPKRGGAIATNKKRILSCPASYDLNTMGVVPAGGLEAWVWHFFAGVDLGTLSDGSNIPQLNNKDIAPLLIPLPPLAEQHRIVDEIDRRFSILDAVEATIDLNLKRCERLRQAILKWAFEGKLVQAEPTDAEPELAEVAR